MNVLGLDPSLSNTGWSILADGLLVQYGSIRPKGTNQAKLLYIYNNVKNILAVHQPDAVSCENQFLGLKSDTLKVLSHVRGVIMLACEEAGLEINYYWPSTVKLQSAGSGKATKEDIKNFILSTYGIDIKDDNITDAIAIAYTYQKLQAEVYYATI